MGRPVLVEWSPFKVIPKIEEITVIKDIIIPPLTRNEIIKNNSLMLSFIFFAITMFILYFLYSIYMERKMVKEYLEKQEKLNDINMYFE